jgi:hypothetical protein
MLGFAPLGCFHPFHWLRIEVARYLLGVATIELKCARKAGVQDFTGNPILRLDDLLSRAITSLNKRHWKVISEIISNTYINLD